MIILCDVDGVVADMLPAWLALYNREYDDKLTVNDITQWALDPFVKPECGMKIYQYLHDPKLYRMTHEVPGALRGIEALNARGHRIVYLSYCVGPEMAHAKWQWLSAHGFLQLGEAVLLSKMGTKELVRGDVMIDDYPMNLASFKSLQDSVFWGGRMLLDAPYNREEPDQWVREGAWGRRVRSWEEITAYLGA